MAVGLSDTTIHTQARQSSRRGLGTIIQQKSLAFLLELAVQFDTDFFGIFHQKFSGTSVTVGHCTVLNYKDFTEDKSVEGSGSLEANNNY